MPAVRRCFDALLSHASGHLARPAWDSNSTRGTTDGTMHNKYDQAKAQDMPIVERVHEVSERHGVPMAQVALAWHWAKGVTAPIVGCSKPARVDDAIAALNVQLTEDGICLHRGAVHRARIGRAAFPPR